MFLLARHYVKIIKVNVKSKWHTKEFTAFNTKNLFYLGCTTSNKGRASLIALGIFKTSAIVAVISI
jgi:hypothetical protein